LGDSDYAAEDYGEVKGAKRSDGLVQEQADWMPERSTPTATAMDREKQEVTEASMSLNKGVKVATQAVETAAVEQHSAATLMESKTATLEEEAVRRAEAEVKQAALAVEEAEAEEQTAKAAAVKRYDGEQEADDHVWRGFDIDEFRSQRDKEEEEDEDEEAEEEGRRRQEKEADAEEEARLKPAYAFHDSAWDDMKDDMENNVGNMGKMHGLSERDTKSSKHGHKKAGPSQKTVHKTEEDSKHEDEKTSAKEGGVLEGLDADEHKETAKEEDKAKDGEKTDEDYGNKASRVHIKVDNRDSGGGFYNGDYSENHLDVDLQGHASPDGVPGGMYDYEESPDLDDDEDDPLD